MGFSAGFSRYFSFLLLALFLSNTALASNHRRPRAKKRAQQCVAELSRTKRIGIVSYNVENLFDPAFQRYKKNIEFSVKGTPPWTEEKFQVKLGQIEKMIRSLPREPEIIALIEVENANVVHHLANRLGYKEIYVTNSRDHRGINVGLIAKTSGSFELVSSGTHWLKGPAFQTRPTRDILEMEFLVNGTDRLLLFVNHWPSQAAPSTVRFEAARQLRTIVQQRRLEDPSANILVMGDFNTIPEDQPNALTDANGLFGKNLGAGLFDVDKAFRTSRSVPHELKATMPLGSSFYAPTMAINKLDVFGASSNMMLGNDGLKLDLPSYRIHLPDFARHDFEYTHGPYEGSVIKNVPKRYNFQTEKPDEAGFSDHAPLYVEIEAFGRRKAK